MRTRLAVVLADVKSDADGKDVRLPTTLARLLFAPRLQAVVLIRIANALFCSRLAVLASLVKYCNYVVTGCDVAPAAQIGRGLRLYHPSGVVIGPHVRVGDNCTIMQHATLGERWFGTGSPQLDDGVFVGPGAVIVGPVKIGRGAIVGANAVVRSSVPDGEFWAGVPARCVTRSDT